jgi:Flp pilus assembly protein TadB
MAVLWGGLMLLWTTRKRTDAGMQWPRLFAHIMCSIFAALLFGILFTFEWAVLHPPLVFVTGLVLGGGLFFRYKAISTARKTLP